MDMDRRLAAVLQRPWDDEPRASFATAVQSEDPPRAELIVAGLELARLHRQGVTRGSVHDDLSVCCTRLKQLHAARWGAAITGMTSGPVAFGRGFIEGVRLSAEDFLAHAHDLMERAPILDVTLTDCNERALVELVCSGRTVQLRSLTLCGPVSIGSIDALVNSPYLYRLCALDLSNTGLGEESLLLLADSRRLVSLQRVRFENNAVPSPVAEFVDEDGISAFSIANPSLHKSLRSRAPASLWLSYRPADYFLITEAFVPRVSEMPLL